MVALDTHSFRCLKLGFVALRFADLRHDAAACTVTALSTYGVCLRTNLNAVVS